MSALYQIMLHKSILLFDKSIDNGIIATIPIRMNRSSRRVAGYEARVPGLQTGTALLELHRQQQKGEGVVNVNLLREVCARTVTMLRLAPLSEEFFHQAAREAEATVMALLRTRKLTGAEWELIAVKREFVRTLAASRKTQILRALKETDDHTKQRIRTHIKELLGSPRGETSFNILDPECWDFRRVLDGENDLARTRDLVFGYVVAHMKEQEETLRAASISLREAVEAFRASQE